MQKRSMQVVGKTEIFERSKMHVVFGFGWRRHIFLKAVFFYLLQFFKMHKRFIQARNMH